MTSPISSRWAAWTLVLNVLPAQALDLGTIGPTYPIAEPHLLQMIE